MGVDHLPDIKISVSPDLKSVEADLLAAGGETWNHENTICLGGQVRRRIQRLRGGTPGASVGTRRRGLGIRRDSCNSSVPPLSYVCRNKPALAL